jgi:hypothetical protein
VPLDAQRSDAAGHGSAEALPHAQFLGHGEDSLRLELGAQRGGKPPTPTLSVKKRSSLTMLEP